MNLENDLKRVLRRQAPPAGFADFRENETFAALGPS